MDSDMKSRRLDGERRVGREEPDAFQVIRAKAFNVARFLQDEHTQRDAIRREQRHTQDRSSWQHPLQFWMRACGEVLGGDDQATARKERPRGREALVIKRHDPWGCGARRGATVMLTAGCHYNERVWKRGLCLRLPCAVRWERFRQPNGRIGDAECPARLGADDLQNFLDRSTRCQRVADPGNRGEYLAVAAPLIGGVCGAG